MAVTMIPRLLKLSKEYSLFLFGLRGAGKSTLVKHVFPDETALYLNFLKPDIRKRFHQRPEELEDIVSALPDEITHIIIDDVQKVPEILDIVHHLIETTDKLFVMTGSSARKLKQGAANLLAGRAFVYRLYPFSLFEIEHQFQLDEALRWGTLPKISDFPTEQAKEDYLDAYAHTYLKEEVWEEHIVRDIEHFRRFLEVAAQMNGKVINFSNIARDTGVDDKTVKNFYTILEDTLIGTFLEGFQHSFRKRLATQPKFYFFDTGIVRSLSRMSSIPLVPQSTAYGNAFEHFIILECIKLSAYFHRNYRLSYLRTKDGVEADLVVERPGKKILFIEIKSHSHVIREHLSSFIHLTKDFGECEAICLSNDPLEKMIDHVRVLPWKMGLKRYFLN